MALENEHTVLMVPSQTHSQAPQNLGLRKPDLEFLTLLIILGIRYINAYLLCQATAQRRSAGCGRASLITIEKLIQCATHTPREP